MKEEQHERHDVNLARVRKMEDMLVELGSVQRKRGAEAFFDVSRFVAKTRIGWSPAYTRKRMTAGRNRPSQLRKVRKLGELESSDGPCSEALVIIFLTNCFCAYMKLLVPRSVRGREDFFRLQED